MATGLENVGYPRIGYYGKAVPWRKQLFSDAYSYEEGYSDNRWLTFRQMEEKGWHFKVDEEGKSVGKGKGATIEFFELRDKETGKPFDRHTLDGMTQDEKDDYFKDNVRPIRKYYRVFNGDLIDGIPEREKGEIDESGYNERAEKIIDFWDKNEAKIVYGGSQAYYHQRTDEVRLPNKEDFTDMPEFYVTALHEIGHSTGHEKRLNRDLSGKFGSPEYALEELRAEIASMFMEQDLEVSVSENHIQNNTAYIQAWHDKIKENPNELFTAIADADKIAKFVLAKEKQKKTEYFAIVQSENAYREQVYKRYI